MGTLQLVMALEFMGVRLVHRLAHYEPDVHPWVPVFGIAKWSSEVTIKELCVKWDPIQWMTTSRANKPEKCQHLCQNMNVPGNGQLVLPPHRGWLEMQLRLYRTSVPHPARPLQGFLHRADVHLRNWVKSAQITNSIESNVNELTEVIWTGFHVTFKA